MKIAPTVNPTPKGATLSRNRDLIAKLESMDARHARELRDADGEVVVTLWELPDKGDVEELVVSVEFEDGRWELFVPVTR